ncbi:putative double-strand break repair protein MRE11A [Apostichopus japonicus]|uniref:Putative double-strand break repair protein MRE11A n=1 Tax=Stichopus japonicus TaxID=307972 RepID=A0A2G8KEN0_STIJA|nr:putative double-strand break repair protein MRE11A [Apostichopus japonicus]
MHSACLTSTHMFPFITTYLFPISSVIFIVSASDCHIGYMEKDPERRNDSLNTFEELLQQAREQKVDMILLGGDLFHHNKPARYFRYHCMRLLKQYCQRDEPSPIEIIPHPDETSSFPVTNNTLTYQTPVFSVHGNHDNPSGLGNLCALDVLSEAGLINHFGKALSHESVEMCPVLIRKGQTKVALYGLGSITDKALHGMFEKGKVSMSEPPVDVQSWFSMFVIHQNRAYRGDKEYIPESFLDEKLKVKLDLVIWGHEHDCQLDPVWYKKRFRIIQPGSTIATSIVKGETKQKIEKSFPQTVFQLQLAHWHFAMDKPFMNAYGSSGDQRQIHEMYKDTADHRTTDVHQKSRLKFAEHRLDPGDVDIESKVEEFCAEQINKMVEAVTRDNASFPKRPLLPLIKLRVDVSGGYPTFNKRRFAQQFVNKVANVRVHGHDEQNLIDFKDKDERKKTVSDRQ